MVADVLVPKKYQAINNHNTDLKLTAGLFDIKSLGLHELTATWAFCNSFFIEILFQIWVFSHPETNKVIAINFCMSQHMYCHDMCKNLYGICGQKFNHMAKHDLHWIGIAIEN